MVTEWFRTGFTTKHREHGPDREPGPNPAEVAGERELFMAKKPTIWITKYRLHHGVIVPHISHNLRGQLAGNSWVLPLDGETGKSF